MKSQKPNAVRLAALVAVVFFGFTNANGAIRLRTLRSAIQSVQKYDSSKAEEFLKLAVEIENNLSRRNRAQATKTLESLADAVFATKQGSIPLRPLLTIADAIVKTQNTYMLPAGVKFHPRHYCKPTGTPTAPAGTCTPRNRTDKCYSYKNGCLGSP